MFAGTGKSMLVKAIAHKYAYKLVIPDPSDLKERFHGDSEKKIKEAFKFAIANCPCILYIDEIDTIVAAERTISESGDSTSTIGQFLGQLNVVLERKDLQLIVIAASNRPWTLPDSIVSR